MRNYPDNSPHASARILAIAMLVDGHADLSEIRAMEAHPGLAPLGVTPVIFDEVLSSLCHDLMISNEHEWSMSVRLPATTQTQMLLEINDPLRQRTLNQLCATLADADGLQHPAESAFLERMRDVWALTETNRRQVFRRPAPAAPLHHPASPGL